MRFLDVGGGNGVDAISFAAQGHSLALLDPSVELINEALHKARAAGVAQQMEFHRAELTEIPKLFPETRFDVVLCHNVLQYIEDIGAALESVCHPLLPGGLISIICVNRYSEPYREALQQLNPKAAYEKLDTETVFSSVFNLPVRAYAAAELSQALQEVGCTLLAQYGVRCVCDYIPNNDLKNEAAFFTELERLEYAMSKKYPYYLLARIFQLIGRKRSKSPLDVGGVDPGLTADEIISFIHEGRRGA
ncbi:MAG: class I SAM-dependent methyltransferase [Chloroflexia bacterium]